MLEILDNYGIKENPVLIYGKVYDFESEVLFVKDDVSGVKFTIFVKDSPESEVETPLEYFTDVSVDPQKAVFDTLQTKNLDTRYGPTEVAYNLKVVIRPVEVTEDGVTTKYYPFPIIGKFYRVVVTMSFHDPELEDHALPCTIEAV